MFYNQEQTTKSINSAVAILYSQGKLSEKIQVDLKWGKNHLGESGWVCASAIKSAKGMSKNPRDIARMIVQQCNKDDFNKPFTISGPGFIFLKTNN